MDPTKDDRLWHLLIGAMLADQHVRKIALLSLRTEDIPKDLRIIWTALAAGNGPAVWDAVGSLGLPDARSSGGTVITALVRLLQEKSLEAFCRAVVDRSAFQKPGMLSVDDVAGTLEGWAAQLRARQAQLKEPKKKEDK